MERILLRVDVGNRQYTRGVVEEVPQEGIPTRGDGVAHSLVRESGCSVDRTQDEIILLGLGVPPGVPGGAEGLAAGDELPLLGCGLVFEAAD
jgi:hypothetical protein